MIDIPEMAGHGFVVMRCQNSSLPGSNHQHLWIGSAFESGELSRLEVNRRFARRQGQKNDHVQIGVRLETRLHGCTVCCCRRASANL